MDLPSFKDWIAGAYKGNPSLTIICTYVIFLVGAIVTHQYIKGISKEAETQHTAQTGPATSTTIIQQSTDSDCSNISAGHDANVDCTSSGRDHDKKKAQTKH